MPGVKQLNVQSQLLSQVRYELDRAQMLTDNGDGQLFDWLSDDLSVTQDILRKRLGREPTVNEIYNGYSDYAEKVFSQVNTNNDVLSKSEIQKIYNPYLQNRAEAARRIGMFKARPAEIREFIMGMVAKSTSWDTNAELPALDSGNGGLHAYLFEGDTERAALEALNFYLNMLGKPTIPDYVSDSVFGVYTTGDEETFLIGVYDHTSDTLKEMKEFYFVDFESELVDYLENKDLDDLRKSYPGIETFLGPLEDLKEGYLTTYYDNGQPGLIDAAKDLGLELGYRGRNL